MEVRFDLGWDVGWKSFREALLLAPNDKSLDLLGTFLLFNWLSSGVEVPKMEFPMEIGFSGIPLV